MGDRVSSFFSRTYIFKRDYCFLCQVRSGGPAICDETQHVTAIIDVDGAPVCEPTHISASGQLQSKLRTCPYCRLLFTTVRDMCDHIRTQHADRRYSCLQCPCTFGSTFALNRHVRNLHQKLVKFRCQICGKSYNDRTDYHDHMAMHAGVKRNVCTICQAQFTVKRSLKAHVMHLHPDAIESLNHS